MLAQEPALAELAGRLSESESLFFVGRVRGYPVAREGAQKFKEISYRHAEAYQTSELKHGPLALIAPTVPTVAIVPEDELTERNVGALHEVAARGGPLVVVTHAAVDLGDLPSQATVDRVDVPRNERELDPILMTVALQLLAYHAASRSGTTSTSRGTSPSRSPSSDPARLACPVTATPLADLLAAVPSLNDPSSRSPTPSTVTRSSAPGTS